MVATVEGFIRHERSPEDKQVRGLRISKIDAPHAVIRTGEARLFEMERQRVR